MNLDVAMVVAEAVVQMAAALDKLAEPEGRLVAVEAVAE
jgi:hypothetical protein